MLSKHGKELKVGQKIAIWWDYDKPTLYLLHKFDRVKGTAPWCTHDTVMLADLSGDPIQIAAAAVCEIIAQPKVTP